MLELDLDSTQMFTSIFGRMLAEPSHEGRHYSLRGKAKVVRQVVEDYVEVGFHFPFIAGAPRPEDLMPQFSNLPQFEFHLTRLLSKRQKKGCKGRGDAKGLFAMKYF